MKTPARKYIPTDSNLKHKRFWGIFIYEVIVLLLDPNWKTFQDDAKLWHTLHLYLLYIRIYIPV